MTPDIDTSLSDYGRILTTDDLSRIWLDKRQQSARLPSVVRDAKGNVVGYSTPWGTWKTCVI